MWSLSNESLSCALKGRFDWPVEGEMLSRSLLWAIVIADSSFAVTVTSIRNRQCPAAPVLWFVCPILLPSMSTSLRRPSASRAAQDVGVGGWTWREAQW